ncbi:MAG TPA: dihydroneopterin aldolase [bacterium]|nr:dihydroneopterin aldolase [bacterium]
MSDRIALTGLAFYAHHGVSAEEQERGQVFTVDVAVEAALHRAGHTDDLADTLDYRDLYARVREAMTQARYHLLEAVAEAIAHALLGVDRVEAVTVRVRKPHVRLGGPLESAAVEVTRRRPGTPSS